MGTMGMEGSGMRVAFILGRWRLLVIAAVAAFAATLSTSQAFATGNGVTVDSSSVIAYVDHGVELVSTRDTGDHLWNNRVLSNGAIDGWQRETTEYLTKFAPFISVLSGVAFLIIVGLDQGQVYWKQVYRP